MDIVLNITMVVAVAVFFISPLVLLYFKLQGTSQKKNNAAEAKQAFAELREIALNAASTLTITDQAQDNSLVVLMETGTKDGVISLRCFADGTVSILFSNGGGTIGIGEHENARKAGLELVRMSWEYISHFKPVTEYPLPTIGKTIFYLVTRKGNYAYESSESELGNNQSELSPLFYKAQDVITQWRIIEEKGKL